MAKDRLSDTLAVILHADVKGSTELVHQDRQLAHERIRDSFQRFSDTIKNYHGQVLELRGDALLASFGSASDAVKAALAFQIDHSDHISHLRDDLRPLIRVGISMGEVVIADNTVTGTGVVQAQRVEQLAYPGGICITAAIHESLSKRASFEFLSLGEKQLKGFDHAIHVYRVELKPGESVPAPTETGIQDSVPANWKLMVAVVVAALFVVGGVAYWSKLQVPKIEVASVENMAQPLPDKPSIAVLPFINMSADAEQEYFVDGMTEDLITDLSKLSGLFVVARNSVFTYKGKAVKVNEVAEELGVRYVMEGSVRRAGNQVRVNAQLIDATTGGHLWADRYDGSLDDVFAMQDQITQSIVTALSVTLVGQEQGSWDRVETDSPEAYSAYLRGRSHYRIYTPDDFVKAISYLENAIELDPGYARAHAALAAVYWEIGNSGWAEGTGVSYDEVLKKVNLHLEQAMKNPTPQALRIVVKQLENAERWNDALAEAERAIALDPNDPNGYQAMSTLLINLGRAAEGLEYIKKAMRLDPQTDYLWNLGWAQFHLERYEEAAETYLKAIRRNPDSQWNHLLLAAAYGHLGREQEAMSSVAIFNNIHMNLDPIHHERPYTLADLSDELLILHWSFKNEAGLERLREGLHKAGVPEGQTDKPDKFKFTDLVTVTEGTFDVEGAIEIDAAEAQKLHDGGIVFMDSRGKGLYGRGHIPGATNLYFHKVWDSLSEVVDKDVEVVFYCVDPRCHLAAHSSAQAIILGYTKVYYFAGGFLAWEAAGYPIEGS